MTLAKSIKNIAPIDSIEKLNELMGILKKRKTCISSDVYASIIEQTDPMMYNRVEQEIQVYKENFNVNNNQSQINPRSKSRKKVKSKSAVRHRGLSPSDPISKQRILDRMNSQSSSNSLRSQGYEYGLSDW